MVERRGVRGKRERGRDPFRLYLPPLFFTIPSHSFILLSSFSSFEREGRKVKKDEGGGGMVERREVRGRRRRRGEK